MAKTWGYFRLAYPTPVDEQKYRDEMTAQGATEIRQDFFANVNSHRHHHEEWLKMLDDAGPGDTIMVVKLSHISAELAHIGKLITKLNEAKGAHGINKNLEFIALRASVNTTDATHRSHFFPAMKELAKMNTAPDTLARFSPFGDSGGDGGGNGGC